MKRGGAVKRDFIRDYRSRVEGLRGYREVGEGRNGIRD